MMLCWAEVNRESLMLILCLTMDVKEGMKVFHMDQCNIAGIASDIHEEERLDVKHPTTG